MTLFAILFATVLASDVLSVCARAVSLRRGILDKPTERSSHTCPTPRLGGVAMVVAFAGAWLTATWWVPGGLEDSGRMLWIWGALMAAAVGLADDVRSLSPTTKLAGQLVALAPAITLLTTEYPGWPLWMTSMAGAFWIVGYTNFFNFMDGSDGMAAGVAVINGISLALLALVTGHMELGWIALLTSATALGFLHHNRAPASIFMGDSGSLFLGYVFAWLGLLLVEAGISLVAVGLALTPFLFDASFTLVRRLVHREPVWRAHHSHLYQRLLATGKSHRHVAYVYWAWACYSGLLALSYIRGANRFVVLLSAAAWIAALIIGVWSSERRARVPLLASH